MIFTGTNRFRWYVVRDWERGDSRVLQQLFVSEKGRIWRKVPEFVEDSLAKGRRVIAEGEVDDEG